MKKLFNIYVILALFSLSLTSQNTLAEEIPQYKIIIKNHQFDPKNLEVPANQKIKLLVENQDKTIEEFESFDLNREKIVAGGKTITIFIGPLNSGTYKYFGEFHPKTAQGTITAK